MRYRQVMSAFMSAPLAILPSKLLEIRNFLDVKARGDDVPDEEVARITEFRIERENAFRSLVASVGPIDVEASSKHRGAIVSGKVGIIPVFGVLSQRVGYMERASGGISTEEIGSTVDGLVEDKQIKSIVLAFDSPGGSVFGVEELGKKLYQAREEKKIVAVADSVMASAALWLGMQATEVVITPGGQAGSLGVLAAHQDVSKQEEMMGVKTTIVSSAQHKTEFAPEHPLSEEAIAELKRVVGEYHKTFVAAVARGRGLTEARVERDFGQGRMLLAKEAVAAGMADRVGTLEQVLRKMGGEDGPRAEVVVPVKAEEEQPEPIAERLAQVRARAVEVEG